MTKLIEILPEFAAELVAGLTECGEAKLARSVIDVEIVERCKCNEPGCVTFHAQARDSTPSPDLCARVIVPADGVTCIKYYMDRIVWVEALGRPKERSVLDAALPIYHAT